MEFGWTAEEDRLREQLKEFLASKLAPGAAEKVPGEDPYSEEALGFCRDLAQRGWMVPHWPKAYGGADASPWSFVILSEEMWCAGEPRGSQYMNVNWIGPAIFTAGTPAQKEEHLQRIAAGEVLWCQGFSEVDAGSDLGSLRTPAVRDGDHYVINGEKVWTSYAGNAHFCFLLARTAEATAPGSGISIFLVPMDTPGVSVEVIPTVCDVHQIHRLRFENVRVPAGWRLGAENEGWNVIRDALADERVGVPRHLRARVVLDQTIREMKANGAWAAHSGARAQAARAAAICRAAQMLAYQTRQNRALGHAAGADGYVARAAIVRAERAVAEFVADWCGEAGVESGSLADGEFRTALIAGLGGGSYEVQLNLIARLWLKLPRLAGKN